MTRLAALLLLVGGALLISWALAPAATPARTDTASPEQTAPIVRGMNAEVDRLRERLDATSPYPAPSRDPFRYGRRQTETAPVAPASVAAAETDAAPPLPRLLAILKDGAGDSPGFRAVMTVGRDVQVLKAGDAIGAFRVERVSADAAELIDPVSLKIFRLVLK